MGKLGKTQCGSRQSPDDWAGKFVDYAWNRQIHRLFEEQVCRTPDAVAVVIGEEQFTYRDLNEQANRLAHFLRDCGVGSDGIVGLLLQRSLEMVWAILGVLKAGGAYLPLDPNDPDERLSSLLNDARPNLLMTHDDFTTRAASFWNPVFTFRPFDEFSSENPVIVSDGNDLAYVIYTSGSTGKPKGVAVPHRGLLNRILWMQDYFRIDTSDIVLQKTPCTFDVSVWEFLWPLIAGAKLVVARPEGHKDPWYLRDLISSAGVTTIHFVPSMLRRFLEVDNLDCCNSLRWVICSGEALTAELQRRFFERFDCELYNLYGPTEASIDVTYWKCRRDSDLDFVPIGWPIVNTQVYILDDRCLPVPVGVVGELYAGGTELRWDAGVGPNRQSVISSRIHSVQVQEDGFIVLETSLAIWLMV